MIEEFLRNPRRPEGAWTSFEDRLRGRIRRRRTERLVTRAALLLLAVGFASALGVGQAPPEPLLRADVPSAAAPLFTAEGATALFPSDSTVVVMEVPG